MGDARELAVDHLLSEGLDDAEVEEIHAALQSESYRAYLDMIVRRPRPERATTPVLVIGGTRDRIFSNEEMRRTAAAYATRAVFVDSAHDLMLDTAWEEVATTAIDWLGRLQPGASSPS